MLTFLSTARLQELDNTGKLLNSGKLYFFALGTTTPKATYQDINGNAANTNPVILDSVGSASIYLNGSYTVSATDKFDVPVGPPVDIAGGINDFITSGGTGSFADNIVISVNTYADVRALSNPYSWVFVQGRETQADGGQGLFYIDQANATSDDDGIILAPQIPGKYIRYGFETIDPRWFGLTYGSSISQAIYLDSAAMASYRFQKPVEIVDSVYLNSDYNTSAYNSSWIFTDYAEMVSTLSINFTFAKNTKLLSCGRNVWSNFVQPKFEENSTEKIKYSWMNASNVEGKVTKFLNCSNVPYIAEIDDTIETTQDFISPDNYIFSVNSAPTSGLIYFNTTSPINLKISDISDGSIKDNIIKFKSFSTIGDIRVPFNLTPKFYCSYGNGISADDVSIQASFKSGNVILDEKYLVSSNNISTSGFVSLYGGLNSLDKTKVLNLSAIPNQSIIFNTSLTVGGSVLENVNLYFTSAGSFNGTNTLHQWNNIYLQFDGNDSAGNFSVSKLNIKDTTIIGDRKLTTSNGSNYNNVNLNNFNYIGNSISATSPFTVMTNIIDSNFSPLKMGTSANIEGIFGSMTNTKIIPSFGSNAINISGTNINNLNFSDNTYGANRAAITILGGTNLINDSQFNSSDYKQLCVGTSGTIDFNNCYIGSKITVSDKSNVTYKQINCVGGIVESNSLINNIINETYSISPSGILTSALADFITLSGSNIRISNRTLDTNQFVFNTSGWYDYMIQPISAYTGVNTSSTSALTNYACVKVCSASDKTLRYFNKFGGKLGVSVYNPGNSRFKVCLVSPDYIISSKLLVASAGSLINSNNYKIVAETPYITFNDPSYTLTTEYQFNTGMMSQSLILNASDGYDSKILTDKFGIRSNTQTLSADYWDVNVDICFVGFIDAGTKIKLTIEAHQPISNNVSNTYFNSTSASINTLYSINDSYNGNPYVSSGINYVSNKWISNPTFNKYGNTLLIEGISPTPYIDSRSDRFSYVLRTGAFYPLDPLSFWNGYFNYKNEISNNLTMLSGVSIKLTPIVSGSNINGYFTSGFTAGQTPISANGGSYNVFTFENGYIPNIQPYQIQGQKMYMVPENYEKPLSGSRWIKWNKFFLND
jgi:hypothetical protein